MDQQLSSYRHVHNRIIMQLLIGFSDIFGAHKSLNNGRRNCVSVHTRSFTWGLKDKALIGDNKECVITQITNKFQGNLEMISVLSVVRTPREIIQHLLYVLRLPT